MFLLIGCVDSHLTEGRRKGRERGWRDDQLGGPAPNEAQVKSSVTFSVHVEVTLTAALVKTSNNSWNVISGS